MATPATIEDHERRHLETPIARARHSDPQTSKDAAASVHHIAELKLHIMAAYRLKGPMIDEQLVHYMREDANGMKLAASESSIRSRRAELVSDDGLVEAVTFMGQKETKVNGRGRRCQIFNLVTRSEIATH